MSAVGAAAAGVRAARAYARSAPALLRVGVASMVAYRAEMVIWILSATMPLIMLALWNAVTAERAVAGFGPVEMTRYFAATLIVRQFTAAWIVWELNHQIRTGGLSPKLLRPLNPLWFEAIVMLAALPLRMVVLAPILAALVLWRPELVAVPGPAELMLFAISVGLAWLLQFLVQAAFALVAFWWDQSMGLFGLWFSVWMLLSGYIAPLDVFPAWARPVLDWLPFRAMLSVPVELLGGFTTAAEALPGVGLQLLWVAGFAALVRWMWARGVARYGAFGA